MIDPRKYRLLDLILLHVGIKTVIHTKPLKCPKCHLEEVEYKKVIDKCICSACGWEGDLSRPYRHGGKMA